MPLGAQPLAIPVTLSIDVDRLADALFDRLRSALVSSLAAPAPPAPPVQPTLHVPPVQTAPDQQTLEQWLPIYEEVMGRRPYKPATVKNHQSNLKHIRRIWGHMPLRAIKPRAITAGLEEFLPDRATMARRVLDELGDVMKEAVIEEWVDSNPVTSARRPRVKVKRKRMSVEVFDAVAEIAISHRQAWIAPMLLLALVTGQRRADLAKMRFDDVVDGCLRIEQQKEAGKGFGARVAIPLTLRMDALGLTLGEVIEICRDYSTPGPTLLRRHDGSPIELSSLSTRFNEVIREAMGRHAYKAGEWPSLHEMRSLAERLYRAQGIDTMTLLGHKSQDMTDKYNDDRGLTSGQWKRLELATATTPRADSASL